MPPKPPTTDYENPDRDPLLFQRAGTRYYEHDAPSQRADTDRRNLESAERLKLHHEAAKRVEDYQIAQQPDSAVLDVERPPRRWWRRIAGM